MRSILVFCLLLFFSVTARAASSVTVNGNHMVAPTNLAIPGWLSVTNLITNQVLTASKIVLTGTGKQLTSSAFGESDLSSFLTSSATNGFQRIIQFNPNQFLVIDGTNVSIISGVLLTNVHTYGITNTGGFEFALTDSGLLADKVIWYDMGDFYVNRDLIYLPAASGNHTVAKFGTGKQLESISNGTGALTNDGSGGIGWYNRFLSTANDFATNLSVFNQTNYGLLFATNPVFYFGDNSGAQVAVSNSLGGDGISFYAQDAAALAMTINAVGNIAFNQLSAGRVLINNNSGNVSVAPNGTGAFTNDSIGNFGWFNDYITSASLDGYGFIFGATNYGTASVIGRGSNFVIATDANLTTAATNSTGAGGTNFIKIGLAPNVSITSQLSAGGIISTNGDTNLTLTASTIMTADANKKVSSVSNGTGALTNNNAGGFGWFNSFLTPVNLAHGINVLTNSYDPTTQDTSTAIGTNLVFGNDGNIVLNFTNSPRTNAVWIKTIQGITTASSPTFQGLTLNGTTADTILKVNNAKLVTSIPNGTGALTNDNAGNFGYFNSFITLVGASNSHSFNGNQFALAEVNGTNVSIKNGALFTNTTTYSSATTTVPGIMAMAGGHNTNALEVKQGPAVVGGFDSNGIATMTVSNATVVYPSEYRIFNQTANGSCTNITTSLTSWMGSGVGSLTLPAGFWQVGRSVVLNIKGEVSTGASPGNNLIQLKLGSQVVATNASLTLTANMVNEMMECEFILTCRTNSASVGFIWAEGRVSFATAAAGAIYGFRYMKSTLPIFDTTASMLLDLASTNGASTTSFQTRVAVATVIP